MNLNFSDDQIQIRDWARKFSVEKVRPCVSAHQTQKISNELLKELSTNGFMALTVPESLGGLGLDAISFSLVIRELARECASTSITVAVTNMIADVLVREATPDQQNQFLKALIDGRSPTASFCLTENQSGSDASALQTKAVREGSNYRINGEKIYVTNGAFSKFFLVMAKTSDSPRAGDSISAFLVDRETPGLHIGGEEDKMGLSASSTIRMSFEDVLVPETQRLQAEGEGFKIAMRALDGGRISVASQALGTAEAALEAGIRYAKEREQFGKPISEFQAIQWKLADAATQISAAQLLIWKAADLKSKSKPHSLEAAQAKLFSTEIAAKVCNEMIQVFGGYGYIKEYPVERYYRDVRVTALYEGTSEIQRIVISRALLS